MVLAHDHAHAGPGLATAPAVPRRTALVLWSLIVLGCLLRPILAYFSIGTNDALSWFEYQQKISDIGLFKFYLTEPLMNHPPLPALWSVLAGKLAGAPANLWDFAFVFKIPMMLADVLGVIILYRIYLARHGELGALLAGLAMAWNPTAMLISAHHGNTDNIMAVACLLAFYLLVDKKSYFWGGLALAAAINVKIFPVLLIPAAFALCYHRRDALKVFGGLGLGALPFMPPLLIIGPSFISNVLGYNSYIGRWGISYWLLEMQESPKYASFSAQASTALNQYGRYLILALLVGLAAYAWRSRRFNGYTVATLSVCLFFIITGGFGVQYLVWPIPLFLAANWRAGVLYSCLSGIGLGSTYFALWQGSIPIVTHFFYSFNAMQQPGPFFLLLAWWTMICYVARTLKSGADAAKAPSLSASPADR
jgi:hypothetical protein